jgi:ankyrin repeat protein
LGGIFVCLIFAGASGAKTTHEEFFSMIASGDFAGIKLAVDGGFEINKLYGDSRDFQKSPLREAIRKRQADVVEFFLKSGADPETQEIDTGISPLMLSVGAAITSDERHKSPKAHADAMRVIDLLLASGADVNYTNIFGDSPLKTALGGTDYETSLEAAKKLIAAGAEINPSFARLGDGEKYIGGEPTPPLLWALITVVAEFEEGRRCNRAGLIKFLLESGADVNASIEGVTPLHAAAMTDYELTKILLDAGADKHAKTPDGRTPLDFALAEKNLRIAVLLIAGK